MGIVVCCGALGVIVAAERGRRDRVIEASGFKNVACQPSNARRESRHVAVAQSHGAVEWDDDVHALFGLSKASSPEPSMDGWRGSILTIVNEY